MHFNVYDVFYSLNSHQHVSAVFCGHLQGDIIIKIIQSYKCDCLSRSHSIIKNNYNAIII